MILWSFSTVSKSDTVENKGKSVAVNSNRKQIVDSCAIRFWGVIITFKTYKSIKRMKV